MYASKMNLITLRDTPADAEVISHQLLVRGGYMHKMGSGVYVYGPLLKRSLDKIMRIIADEISKTGALEITMPLLQEKSLWERSGRWDVYQASGTLLTTTDRNQTEFGLSPTAEEVVTDYVASLVKSYKNLPVCYFQQHTKFRDEIRPRFGLLRVKEFVMMDAYSFHDSEESLNAYYEEIKAAYHTIFKRLGLNALAVEADAGDIGGSGSHEFMVTAEIGEDTILFDEQGYAANVERAVGQIAAIEKLGGDTLQKVNTPGTKTVAELVAFLNQNQSMHMSAGHVLKCNLYRAQLKDKTVSVAAFVRGDREINEIKLQNALAKAARKPVFQFEQMPPEEVENSTGSVPGYIGPGEGLNVDFCFFDQQIDMDAPMVAGANEIDTHVVGFVPSRDVDRRHGIEDIVTIKAGDLSPNDLPLQEKKGIEVGHVFKLGTKYSQKMGAKFQDQSQKLQPFIMGCYGIGSSRIVAAAIEQHHDKFGIQWPLSIAPYEVVVVPTGKDAEGPAQKLYEELLAQGIEVILDDRNVNPGVKFKDWDLVGIPLRVVCGRGLSEGMVELKPRNDSSRDIPLDQAQNEIMSYIQEHKA